MALSQLDIIKIALGKIGESLITSLTDGTKQQIYAMLNWDNTRDSLLTAHNWNFATTRIALIASAGVSPIGYNYAYNKPSDCLKVQKICTDEDFRKADIHDYKIELVGSGTSTHILTDEASGTTIYLKYTKQVSGTSSWPSTFTKAFTVALGVDMSEALTGLSAGDKQLLLQEYDAYIERARGIDFEEGQNEKEDYYEMIVCRD